MAYPAYLSYGTPAKTMHWDAVESETLRFSAAVTEFPVEVGPNVSDHVRAELDSVSLTVFVSNSPIVDSNLLLPTPRGVFSSMKLDIPQYTPPFSPTPGFVTGAAVRGVDSLLGGKKVDSATVLQFSAEFNSVSEIIQELRRLRDSAEIIKIITPHWDAETMVITSVEVPRTPEEGDGARLNIELRQIVRVETKRTAEPVPTVVRGKKGKKAGTKDPAPQARGQSTASAILELAKEKLKGGILP